LLFGEKKVLEKENGIIRAVRAMEERLENIV